MIAKVVVIAIKLPRRKCLIVFSCGNGIRHGYRVIERNRDGAKASSAINIERDSAVLDLVGLCERTKPAEGCCGLVISWVENDFQATRVQNGAFVAVTSIVQGLDIVRRYRAVVTFNADCSFAVFQSAVCRKTLK